MHISFLRVPSFLCFGVPTILFQFLPRSSFPPSYPIHMLPSSPLTPFVLWSVHLSLPFLFFHAPDRSYPCSSAIWACPVSFLLLKSSLHFFSRLKGDKSARNSEHRALNPGGKTFAHLPCRKASSLRVKVGSFSQIRFEIPEQVDDRGVHKVRFMSLLLLRPSLVPSKLNFSSDFSNWSCPPRNS